MNIESVVLGIKEIIIGGIITVICTTSGSIIGGYLDHPLVGSAFGFIIGLILSCFFTIIGQI